MVAAISVFYFLLEIFFDCVFYPYMMIILKQKLHYWPIITCAWFTVTFTISYTWSVANKHVYPFFPYVSDTGTTPPESCVFGQMLNIGAIILGICMYIRYRQIEFAINSNEVDLQRKWNEVAFWLGNITCLGISFVGNFQEMFFISMHLVGALMAFGVGGFYVLLQTKMSFAFRHINYKNPKYGVGRYTLYIRILITALFFVFLFSTIICAPIAHSQFTGDNILYWSDEHGGFELHQVATLSEWLLVTSFLLYTLTAINEFKSLEFEEVRFLNKLATRNNAEEMS